IPVRERTHVVRGDVDAVLVAQQVLEQDLERIRQIVDSVADGIESIDTVALPAHGERLARAEAVSHREPRMGSEWKTRKPELYQARTRALGAASSSVSRSRTREATRKLGAALRATASSHVRSSRRPSSARRRTAPRTGRASRPAAGYRSERRSRRRRGRRPCTAGPAGGSGSSPSNEAPHRAATTRAAR